jgi:hypothetical protein
LKTTLRIGWIFLCLTLAFVCRCWNVRDVFLEGHIYFVDGDCYSRMTRARMIAEHSGMIIRHHDFENWPDGVTAHTTAPLDYLIVWLTAVLDGLFRLFDPGATSLLHHQTLDLAGALISPLLGIAGAVFLACWLAKFRVRYGWVALLFYAISPILVHGTLLGRPDHQSLLMFTITVALGAELALARSVAGETTPVANARNWGIVSGLAWSVSLWVSLYEPSILLLVVLGLWLLFDRHALWTRTRLPGAVVFLVVLAVALILEGWSVEVPNAEMRAFFANWEHTIGELAHLHPVLLFGWLGWVVVLSPILLLLAWKQDRRALPLLLLLVVTLGLTIWQARWGYFLGIVFAWTLPWQMQALRKWWLVWPVVIVGLWPVLGDWDARLFPKEESHDRQTMKRDEVVALRDLSAEAIGEKGGSFLASWWLSPAIAYWSGQPGVAGTSHESLPGIVDTARFFLSTDPKAAAEILRRRKVHWVVADDPEHEIDTSSTLLGVVRPDDCLAVTLFDHPEDVPHFLREWNGPAMVRKDGIRFYRLYEFIDANLSP